MPDQPERFAAFASAYERIVLAFVDAHGAESFCLALLCDEIWPLPPIPLLGPTEHVLSSQFQTDPLALWNPAEWPEPETRYALGRAAVEHPDLDRTHLGHSATFDELQVEAELALVDDIARRLNEALASRTAGPLPAFAVYATDPSTADLPTHFAAAVPKHVQDLLRPLGILPWT